MTTDAPRRPRRAAIFGPEPWTTVAGAEWCHFALQLVAPAAIAARRYDRYPDAARRLGSDGWMPVVALAESAVEARRPDRAVKVFLAADQPGWHRDFLRQRCLDLTGVTLDDPPRSLRAVR